MANKLEVRFEYTDSEYFRAMRTYFFHLKAVRIEIILMALCIIFFAFKWAFDTPPGLGYLALVALVILAIMLTTLFFITPGILYRNNPNLRAEIFLTFSNIGIEVKTGELDSKLEWKIFHKIWESKKFYYLIYGKNISAIIPKRAFASPDEETRFRQLLISKIKAPIVKI